MDNDLKALSGAWIQAIGTILAAIPTIPSLPVTQEVKSGLSLIGNAGQATGNALLADSEEKLTLNKIGNEIQSFGNSLVIASILIPFNEELKTNLDMKGNFLQALGSAASLPDLLEKDKTIINSLNIQATLLQTIGNSLQGLSQSIDHEKTQETVDFAGSWIQTAGAVLQALTQTKTYELSKTKSSRTFADGTAPSYWNGAVSGDNGLQASDSARHFQTSENRRW